MNAPTAVAGLAGALLVLDAMRRWPACRRPALLALAVILLALLAGCADPVAPPVPEGCYIVNLATHQNDWYPACPFRADSAGVASPAPAR